MRAGTRELVALYPQAFRERWGHELTDEAGRTGWRSWPHLLIAAGAMRLHPATWPTDSATQRGTARLGWQSRSPQPSGSLRTPFSS